ncbi:MAG: hypothetical protein RL347_190 [Actinomycetota bacterium]
MPASSNPSCEPPNSPLFPPSVSLRGLFNDTLGGNNIGIGHDAPMTTRSRRLSSAVLALGLVLVPVSACSQNQNQNQNDQQQNQNQ